MTDPAYTLLYSTILASGSGHLSSNPWHAPAVAVLSDGTFLAAVQIEDTLDSIFIQHLAADLSVLGSTSIDGTLSSDFPAPYLVATKNTRAVLIARMGWLPNTYFTTVIDCSGGGMSLGPVTPLPTAYTMALDDYGVCHFYDPVTNRIVLISGPLQVFDAITGTLLSEVTTSLSTGLNLYMDPADSTGFTLMDATPQQTHLTVALDGSRCTVGASVGLVHPPPYTYQPMAIGTPYAPDGLGMISSSEIGLYPVNYYDASGALVSTYAMVGSEYINIVGQPAALLNYTQPVVYAEMFNAAGTGFEGALFAADLSTVPATLKKVVLPYLGGGGFSYGTLINLIAADQTTGVILIGASCVNNVDVTTTNLWVIQGPPGGTGITPPLRQVQRDDGLARSVPRARGGKSMQYSIRQRGYR